MRDIQEKKMNSPNHNLETDKSVHSLKARFNSTAKVVTTLPVSRRAEKVFAYHVKRKQEARKLTNIRVWPLCKPELKM